MTSERFNFELTYTILGLNGKINKLEDAIKLKDLSNIDKIVSNIYLNFNNYIEFRKKTFNYETNRLISTDSRTLISLLYKEISILSGIVVKHLNSDKPTNEEEENICLNQINLLLVSILEKYNQKIKPC